MTFTLTCRNLCGLSPNRTMPLAKKGGTFFGRTFFKRTGNDNFSNSDRAWFRLISLGVTLGGGVVIGALCVKTIQPGYVGVVVNMFGTSKGVQDLELNVGAQMRG